jgi:hypothetical protein
MKNRQYIFLLTHPPIALSKNVYMKAVKNAASLQWFLLTAKNCNTLFAFIKIEFLKNHIREMDFQN